MRICARVRFSVLEQGLQTAAEGPPEAQFSSPRLYL